jgi:putative transcriptional regulator
MAKREKLKEFRISQKMTQQEMADKLEISIIQYQFIELGNRNPSFEVLSRFKNAFKNSSIDKIFLS